MLLLRSDEPFRFESPFHVTNNEVFSFDSSILHRASNILSYFRLFHPITCWRKFKEPWTTLTAQNLRTTLPCWYAPTMSVRLRCLWLWRRSCFSVTPNCSRICCLCRGLINSWMPISRSPLAPKCFQLRTVILFQATVWHSHYNPDFFTELSKTFVLFLGKVDASRPNFFSSLSCPYPPQAGHAYSHYTNISKVSQPSKTSKHVNKCMTESKIF